MDGSLSATGIFSVKTLVRLRPATGKGIGDEGCVVWCHLKRSKAAGQILFEEDLE